MDLHKESLAVAMRVMQMRWRRNALIRQREQEHIGKAYPPLQLQARGWHGLPDMTLVPSSQWQFESYETTRGEALADDIHGKWQKWRGSRKKPPNRTTNQQALIYPRPQDRV